MFAANKLPFYFGLVFCVFIFALAGRELLGIVSASILAEQDARLERDWEFKVRLKNLEILLLEAQPVTQPEQGLQERFQAEFHALSALLADDAAQKANVDSLERLALRRLHHSEDRGDPGALAALEDAIDAEQSALIGRREEQIREHYWITLVCCSAASAVFMILLALFYRFNQRYFARLKQSRSELESKNDDLKIDIALRAEQLSALSHHLLAVSEQEKASMARELHDELGSNLTAIRLDLLATIEKVKESDACLAAQLRRTLELLQKTYDIKRRIIENLRPGTLEHLGLAAATRSYAGEIAQRAGFEVEVEMGEDTAAIDSERAIAMYRIIQESLTNAAKYAQASRVSISLFQDIRGLHLRISDNGVGFSRGILSGGKSHGIVGMRERASLLGGRFSIGGDEDGRGTRIDVFLPESGRHPSV